MKTKRWLSLLTAMAMLLGLVAVSTSAEETTDPVPDLTLAGVMSQETLEQNGHVRLTENFADNLYQAEYENADGTRTVYFFSTPVKYVTDEGEVAYIDTSLKSTGLFDRIKGYAYKTAGNAVDVYFPAKSDGKVLLEWENISITQQICEAAETGITGNVAAARSVQYAMDDAADAPMYSYQPTVTGYSGTVQFATLAAVEDVAIQLSGEDVTALSATGDIIGIRSGNKTVATVYGAELLDANGAFVQCAEVTAASQNGVHTVTFSFDSTAIPANVAYPLTFTYYTSADQSAWESETAATASTYAATSSPTETETDCAIQDTMVYESAPNANYNDAVGLFLSGGAGQSRRIYTKFDLSSLSSIRYDRILSARYSIYQNYNYVTLNSYLPSQHFDIEMHQVSGNYNPATITWNNKPTHYEQRLAGESIMPKKENGIVTHLARYHFMLTSLVQGWLQGLPNNGIVFLMRNESDVTACSRAFSSSNNTTNGPVFTVTYTMDTSSSDNIGIEDGAYYYIKCKGSVTENSTSPDPLYLHSSGSTSVNVKLWEFEGQDEQAWLVEACQNDPGYFYLRPSNMSTYFLYATGDVLYETKVGNPTGAGWDAFKKWKFIRNWDGSYHIVSKAGGGTLGLGVARTAANLTVYHSSLTVNMDHLDDWTLEKVYKGTANVFCFNDNAYEQYNKNTEKYVRITENNTVAQTTAGFYGPRITASGYNLSVNVNHSASSGRDSIGNSDIWLFAGHGGESRLWFATSSGTSYLYTSSAQGICNLDGYTKHELSGLRYAMIRGCEVGMDDTVGDNTYNIIGTLYYNGAHFAQAHVNNTNYLLSEWKQYFWYKAELGATIEEAMCYADTQMWARSSFAFRELSAYLYNRHILGDTAQCLNPQP